MADRRADRIRLPGERGWAHRESECPGCGKLINATSDPKGRGPPHPGDLTLAICCGTILRFDMRLRLTVPTIEELERLPQSTLAELKEQQDRWRIRESNQRVISLPPRR